MALSSRADWGPVGGRPRLEHEGHRAEERKGLGNTPQALATCSTRIFLILRTSP